MPSAEFQCPICRGIFGVEVSASSVEVVCPHCSNVVGVPAMSSSAGPPPGSLPPPPPPLPPPPGASLPATTFPSDPPAEQSVVDASNKKADATKGERIAERLLPPGATGPMTYQQPLPTAPMEEPSLQIADSDILIPTEEGNRVALHEPVKRVTHHGEVIELRRLTPEEKLRRRRNRTFCMILVAATILLATIYFLLGR